MGSNVEVLEHIDCSLMGEKVLRKILEEFKNDILIDGIFQSPEKFKISEERYKFSDNYKISLVSDSGDIRHFYICDLVSLIGESVVYVHTDKGSALMAKLNEYQLRA